MRAHLGERGTVLVESELACTVETLGLSKPSDGYLHETWFVSSAERQVVLKRFDQTLIGDLTIPLDDLIANTELAGRQGIGAKVLRIDVDMGLMLLEKLPGAPLEADDIRDGGALSRVADALRRLHDCRQVPANRVDFLRWSDDWLQSLAAVECRWFAELAAQRDELDRARALAGRLPFTPSFIHNDLLLANFIDTGFETAIIDYDFSGTGCPYFDIGCLFGNCALEASARRRFLERYLGRGEPVAEAEVDAALASVELYELLAVHANAVVFAWAAYGYRSKFAPIMTEMDQAVEDQAGRTRAALAEGRHRALIEQLAGQLRR